MTDTHPIRISRLWIMLTMLVVLPAVMSMPMPLAFGEDDNASVAKRNADMKDDIGEGENKSDDDAKQDEEEEEDDGLWQDWTERKPEQPAKPKLTEEEIEERGPPQPGDIQQVIADLKVEGKGGWDDGRKIPRWEADYAHEKNLTLETEEIVKYLMRRVDRNPFIDAYVKWQLLSFDPDIESLSDREIQRIVHAFSPIIEQPRINGKFAQIITAANHEEASQRQILMSDKVYEIFKDEVQRVADENKPGDFYREAFLDRVPERNGLKLMMHIEDLKQRLKAGDRRFSSASSRFVTKAKAARDDENLTPRMRQQIMREVKRLGQMRIRIDTLRANKTTGRPRVSYKTISMYGSHQAKVMAYMQGRSEVDADPDL